MKKKTRWLKGVALAGLALALGGFGCETLTRSEAAAALEEAGLDAEASSLTSGSIEIATSFTIGDGVETAASEIAAFVQSQLPCAEVTLSGATLTVEYGANPGACTYRGHTYGGIHQVTVMRNQMDDVVVEHQWTDFHDEDMSVTGHATVTWSFADSTRHVVHELTWTRQRDGRTGTGSGDRLQAPLEEGLLSGFSVDGTRRWEGEAGTWDLAIDGVQMRWVDPVPQAGDYTLTTPAGKSLGLGFARADATTITVTISNGSRSYDFDVTTVPSGG